MSGFLRWFLPPVEQDADELDRIQLAILIAWVMVVVFVVLSVIHLAARNLLEALINSGLGFVAAAGPFSLRYGVSYRIVLNAVLAACFVGTVSLVLVHGPGVNTATVAIAEVPIFATLLGGIRVGAIWVALSGLAGVVIGLLGHAGRLAATSTYETRLFNDHAALLVITGTLFLVAALYERGRRNSLVRIAALNASRQAIEREKMEVELAARIAHTERLASLGRIAAAAAHEINNPLSYVANNLEFAQWTVGQLEGHDEMRTALGDAREGVERIERIVNDLRGVTRDDDTIGSVDLARVMMTATKMAAAHTRPRARVTTAFADNRHVIGNEGRLVQVFLNLLVNAAQGIPEGSASRNEIAIRTVSVGDRVEVTVEDSGMREVAFSGDGAALGLALSQGIIDSIGGTLQFESRPGSTVAKVTLIAGVHVSAPIAQVEIPSERIFDVLIIDDEVGVARAIARGLRPHRITIVERGREGLALLAAGRHFDLILCDLMMPDLSGMDVHDEIVRTCPHALVHLAFMSGGAFTERAKEFCARTTLPFLDKPLDLKRIRALLDNQAHARDSAEPIAPHTN